MKKLLATLVLLLTLTFNLVAFADAQGFVSYQAIPATDTTINFNGYFRGIQVWTDTGSADVYMTFNNQAATVGGANTIKIQAGKGAGYQSPTNANLAIRQIHIIGATATGNINIVAQ